MQARINHHDHEPSEPYTELRQVSPETLPETWQGGEGGPAPRAVLSQGGGATFQSKRTSALVVTRGRGDVLRESAGTDCKTLGLSAEAAYFE